MCHCPILFGIVHQIKCVDFPSTTLVFLDPSCGPPSKITSFIKGPVITLAFLFLPTLAWRPKGPKLCASLKRGVGVIASPGILLLPLVAPRLGGVAIAFWLDLDPLNNLETSFETSPPGCKVHSLIVVNGCFNWFKKCDSVDRLKLYALYNPCEFHCLIFPNA